LASVVASAMFVYTSDIVVTGGNIVVPLPSRKGRVNALTFSVAAFAFAGPLTVHSTALFSMVEEL
jgi:hypothetical protein